MTNDDPIPSIGEAATTGKYDELAAIMCATTQAKAIFLGGVDGMLGTGFSIAAADTKYISFLPGVLRKIADDIEKNGDKNTTKIDIKL
jgi:hypothetical protein